MQTRDLKQIQESSFGIDSTELENLHNKLVDKHQFRKVGVALLYGTTYLNTGGVVNIKDREYRNLFN